MTPRGSRRRGRDRHTREKGVPMGTIMPFDFHGTEVRTTTDTDGNPWFVAADVAKILDYRDAANMTRNLDDDEKGTQIVSTPGGDQELTTISESGLYHAIFSSRKPEAGAFRRWVTGDVLPEIRRTGTYSTTPAPVPALEDHTMPCRLVGVPGTYAPENWALLLAAVQRLCQHVEEQQPFLTLLSARSRSFPDDSQDVRRALSEVYATVKTYEALVYATAVRRVGLDSWLRATGKHPGLF